MARVAAKIKALRVGEVADLENSEDFAFIRHFPNSSLYWYSSGISPKLKSILVC